MKPTPELIKRIHLDKLEQSRRMHPIGKLFAGPRLHDMLRERMRLGLELTHPDISEEEVDRIIAERFIRQKAKDDEIWTV